MAQTFKHTFAFNLLFIFSFIPPSFTECNVPSDFWCDNADIANQCGVFEQCQKWLTSTPSDAPVVQVGLYYEYLCPACKLAIVHQLKPAFEKVHEIMNLTVVPYGNTKEEKQGDQWIFNCQHGEQECLGNQIECANQHPVPLDKIIACSQSLEGNQMEHEMGLKTPKHDYVPWFTLNGIHTDTIQNQASTNLIALVCKTYTGSPKPAACTKE